jgi:type II secretory ATPase GspE/PulE/Tfp pilus assembly ATPase PilB-like protein
VALVVVPSFTGVPWTGLAWVVALWLTAVACVAISSWAVATTEEVDVAGGDRWALAFGLLPALVTAIVLFGGRWSLPVAWGLGAVLLIPFVRQRDTAVPESRAFLARGGLGAIRAEVTDRLRQWRGAEADERPRSLREQFADLVGRGKSALSAWGGKGARGKAKKAAKRAARKPPAAAPPRDAFTLFKKDGSVLMSLPLDGGDKATVSANVRNTQKLLMSAIRGAVTDLVLEPGSKHYLVRAGTGGGLRDAEKVPVEAARGVLSSLKAVAGMKVAEPGGQGAFGVSLGEARYDVQVVSTAEEAGEKIVLAIHQATGGMLHVGLDGLGLRPKALEQLRDLARKPHGLLLVVGPPGSGRSTTSYALLREIDTRNKKVTTIEETIESRLEGVTQIAVETSGGATFGSVMKMVLKQDPDVIYVASLPDRATVELACQAALTGHMVIATTEAKDTLTALTDLMEMGIEPMLLQTSLTGVVAQRLARRLCAKCRVPTEPPEAVLRKCNLQVGAVQRIFKPRDKGCPACGGTGFRGRLGLHEVLAINEQVRRLIASPLPAREVKAAAVLNGMLTLQLDGLSKVLQGETGVDEVLAVTS